MFEFSAMPAKGIAALAAVLAVGGALGGYESTSITQPGLWLPKMSRPLQP